MDKTEHTPGPWAIGDENNECCEVVLGEKFNLVASLDRQDGNTGKFVIGRDEMLANARLIAAAPEMLAALKRLCDTKDDDVLLSWAAARAAISKAIGGSNGA